MTKKMIICLLAACLILPVMGCSTTTKQSPAAAIDGIDLQELPRNEFVIMDTVEGSGKVQKICGITLPFKLKAGHIANYAVAQPAPSALAAIFPFLAGASIGDKARAMAVYDVLAQVPNADAIVPLSSTVEVSGFPIFYKVATGTAKGKSLRIKTDSEMGY